MKGIRKQVFSWLIVLSICMSLIPMGVIAQGQNEDAGLSDNETIGIIDESQLLEMGANPPEISTDSIHTGDYWYEDIAGGVKIVSYLVVAPLACAKNGESAGTEGFSLRLEGIQIMVVPKDSAAPGSTAFPFMSSLN